MKKPIEYGEYKEIIDVLQRTNVEDNYQDLMAKEDKVLETVNTVVKYYRDEDIKDGEFINQGLGRVIVRFLDVWKEIMNDFTDVTRKKTAYSILTEGDRLIYIGLTLIIVALFLFFVESSNW